MLAALRREGLAALYNALAHRPTVASCVTSAPTDQEGLADAVAVGLSSDPTGLNLAEQDPTERKLSKRNPIGLNLIGLNSAEQDSTGRNLTEHRPVGRIPAVEDPHAFPRTRITAAENVTNRLSEQFYRDHGVSDFEPPMELQADFRGAAVMRTRHCPMWLAGRCPREKTDRKSAPSSRLHDKNLSTNGSKNLQNPPAENLPADGAGNPQNLPVNGSKNFAPGDLFLVHGRTRLRVETDCTWCETTLVKL